MCLGKGIRGRDVVLLVAQAVVEGSGRHKVTRGQGGHGAVQSVELSLQASARHLDFKILWICSIKGIKARRYLNAPMAIELASLLGAMPYGHASPRNVTEQCLFTVDLILKRLL